MSETLTRVVLLDTQTGEKKEMFSNACSMWWADGNGSCDCNRELEFGVEDDDRNCSEALRYLIVDHDYIDYSVRGLNDYYPMELVDKYIPTESDASKANFLLIQQNKE